jgi:hypothetical protein
LAKLQLLLLHCTNAAVSAVFRSLNGHGGARLVLDGDFDVANGNDAEQQSAADAADPSAA